MSLQLLGVSKRFGSVEALRDVSLEFRPGEVHAVLGENGAGKSTLVNIVAGFAAQDAGRVLVNGSSLPPGDPVAARRSGLGVVHQHFTLVPNFTVAENIALFRMRGNRGRFNVKSLAEPAVRKAAELGWAIDPALPIKGLPVGVQQRVEILKSLCDDEPVLLFDEPTATLAPDEVDDLLRNLRHLASEGRVVVLIAHKLKEVLAVADRVTVLRRGKVEAASLDASAVSAERLAELMVGELPPSTGLAYKTPLSDGLEVVDLEVRGDSGAVAVRNVTFSALSGEIFGIGGVDGNGQVELAEALAGIRRYRGSVRMEGQEPGDVAYIPANRQADGLALGMSVAENLLLGRLATWPRLREIAPWARQLMQRYDVRADGPHQIAGELSGGNQQKLVVARTLDRNPPLVVAVNPTRGLDLKATAFVYDQLRNARDRGAAVVLVSADLDELFAVANRVNFMSAGKLTEANTSAGLVGGTP